jgi:predicted RNase H-related nuclease YkuK (DUF458 family)
MKSLNIDEVRDFIQAQSADTKIYLGADSCRFRKNGKWHAEYTLAIVVHINGNRGCKIFGESSVEPDYDHRKDRPRLRLMNECYKLSELYLKLADILQGRQVEIHLDLNPNKKYGSSCAVEEAIGYIRGTCNMTPMVKPHAWAASAVADRLTSIQGVNVLPTEA